MKGKKPLEEGGADNINVKNKMKQRCVERVMDLLYITCYVILIPIYFCVGYV